MVIGKENQNNLLPFVRVGAGILGVFLLATIVSRLVYPFCNGTWESMNWMPAAHLLEGKNPYSYAFTPPYSMLPYGIFYYVLLAAGVASFGFQMWFGRILSIAAFAVCIWAIVKITKKLTDSKEAAWLACLAGLAMFPAQSWIGIMRPDLIAAAFGLVAMYLAFTLEEDKKTPVWRGVWMVLLSLAALFTKQTLLLPAGFIFLRFLQIKKWREAVWFISAFAVAAFSIMFLLNYTSSGGFFWQQFTNAEKLPYRIAQAALIFTVMLKQPTFLFSLVLLSVFGCLNRQFFKKFSPSELLKVLRSPKFLVFLYFAGSLIWAFLSAGREGGNTNYYIENSFSTALVCALIYEYFKRNALPRRALATVILLLFGSVFQQIRVLRGEYFRWQALSYYREISDTVGKLTQPGSDCISIYPELVVWNGCRFNFDDFEEYNGTWSPELIEIFGREIRSGRFAAIVWYDDTLQSKFPNYRLVPMSQKIPEKYFPAYLYVPETRQTK